MRNNNNDEIKENVSKGEIIRTHCNKCGRDMNHEVLMDYFVAGTVIVYSEPDLKYGRRDYTEKFSDDYQVVKCAGCDIITYRTARYDSGFADIDDDGTWEDRFPKPEKRNKKDFKHLPSSFTKIYQEVIAAYNNDGFILCAAGIRAILEGICKDKGITDGDLKTKIQKMFEQRLITQQQENILHKLRFLGNDAIHELQVPGRKEIEAAMDIIEHIVEDLYEIAGKAEILMPSRENAK
jgi:hypothetical protein